MELPRIRWISRTLRTLMVVLSAKFPFSARAPQREDSSEVGFNPLPSANKSNDGAERSRISISKREWPLYECPHCGALNNRMVNPRRCYSCGEEWRHPGVIPGGLESRFESEDVLRGEEESCHTSHPRSIPHPRRKSHAFSGIGWQPTAGGTDDTLQ